MIKYFDIFAGIGGFRSGLEKAGGFECVGYCEIDRYAKKAYEGRFVNMPSTSYTDRDGNKQYSDIFHAVTKSARNALNQAVLNAYDVKLQQIQATEIEVENTPDEEMSDEPADEPEPEMSM